jgi:hypothetical protein
MGAGQEETVDQLLREQQAHYRSREYFKQAMLPLSNGEAEALRAELASCGPARARSRL